MTDPLKEILTALRESRQPIADENAALKKALADVSDKIECWSQESADAVDGKYGYLPSGKSPDHWNGRKEALYELRAFLPNLGTNYVHVSQLTAANAEIARLKHALAGAGEGLLTRIADGLAKDAEIARLEGYERSLEAVCEMLDCSMPHDEFCPSHALDDVLKSRTAKDAEIAELKAAVRRMRWAATVADNEKRNADSLRTQLAEAQTTIAYAVRLVDASLYDEEGIEPEDAEKFLRHTERQFKDVYDANIEARSTARQSQPAKEAPKTQRVLGAGGDYEDWPIGPQPTKEA